MTDQHSETYRPAAMRAPTRTTSSPIAGLACACFVLSGGAALVYQVAWQRLLALSSGVAVYSVAAITAAFMAGMGVGSYLGGVWSRHLSRHQAVRAFAILEVGLAAFALFSVPLYYDLLYRQLSWLYETPAGAFVVHFVSLLLPTTLMGMSLPLLARGLVSDSSEAPRTIGYLYAANTLGAAAGAFLTPWIFLRFLGVDGAVGVGAIGSALAAVGALLLHFLIEKDRSPVRDANQQGSREPASSAALAEEAVPFGWWAALYALSGFVSLSLEMLWFRVLDVGAKGAAFTFGTLLGVYLLGMAGGTYAASLRAPEMVRPLRAFVACQGLMLVTTLLAHIVLVKLPASFPVISWIIQYGASGAGLGMQPFAPRGFFVMYVALPLALFGPATFLMGFGFPILQRAVQRDLQNSGRTVGLLQAANIAGCTLGSLITGLVLLDRIGTSNSFRVLALLGAVVTVSGARVVKERRFYGLTAALVLLAMAFPKSDELWLRLTGGANRETSLTEEDAASVTVLTPRDPPGYTLWINGRTNSWLPFGGIHTLLGALPALIHPAPKKIAIIGLGSGDTAWAAALRDETQEVTVFEIATSLPRLLTRVKEGPLMGDLKSFLEDRRLRIVKDDGRRRLDRDGLLYDIIETDAVFPNSGLAAHLYSLEFYELVARSLTPGGMMCAWAATPRSKAAALQAFPHAIDFGSMLLLSNEEVPIDLPVWGARLRSRRSSTYLGEARLAEIDYVLKRAVRLPKPAAGADINRDLQPKDEFSRPSTH